MVFAMSELLARTYVNLRAFLRAMGQDAEYVAHLSDADVFAWVKVLVNTDPKARDLYIECFGPILAE